MSVDVNTKLINSLAQIITALKPEEQVLLSQTVQKLNSDTEQPSQDGLGKFFQDIDRLPIDPNQPTLQEISEEVKTVRRELWTEA